MQLKLNLLILLAGVIQLIIAHPAPINGQEINDSTSQSLISEFEEKLTFIEQQRVADSIRKSELEIRLRTAQTNDILLKESLLKQLGEIETAEKKRLAEKKSRIDSLKGITHGYPVLGINKDTLFLVYTRLGSQKPLERAENISKRIKALYNDDFLDITRLRISNSDYTTDIQYNDIIILSLSETDALWENKALIELSNEYRELIEEDLKKALKYGRWGNFFMRIGMVIFVILAVWLALWLVKRGYFSISKKIESNKSKWLKNLAYKDYTFLSADQEFIIIQFLLKVTKWIFYAILLYVGIPLIFSIFPFTRGWADDLFLLIWNPFKGIFTAIWQYLPNLFTIAVIYLVMKYFIRFVKYVFSEISDEKLKIAGFHADWAMPTYSIVRFLLYAFMFVLIFPYLPGSNSAIFQGVSVFIGILFSLGSSSAIANMVAGLVITYMRPFKINDRIRIGEVTGDVIEKTLLVTRIKTPKNEIITIPNSSVLNSNTINYSTEAINEGLIIHTTVTIGYDVSWKTMHKVLTEAAHRTEMILKTPSPFVLQTSLDDFYVSYQINGYTKEVNRLAKVYSDLHQNIQDVCNENGVEIMSPHYRATRDGNTSTIPSEYLPADYKAPTLNVTINPAK